MAVVYNQFLEEALQFCATEGIDTKVYDDLNRRKLHEHMFEFMKKFYYDAHEVNQKCRMFEQRFWRENI